MRVREPIPNGIFLVGPVENASTETEPDSSNAALARPDTDIKTELASYQSTKSLNRTPSVAVREDAGDSIPDSPPVAAADPTSIGRYSVIRRLGSGGFGTVYLARDGDLNRTVAIKVPHRQAFGSARQVDEFLNEARMAAQFRHPAIIAVYDVGREPDGGIYIVLEYVDGLSLSEILKNGDYSLERLVDILARVAEAVHHAHKRGLVHRDLKPANILVDSEGNPRVADFGLAIRDDVQRLRSGEVAGTAPYMSPEQVQGETHRLDGRTDVWALGVTLYRVLTGRRPFSGNLDELIDEIRYRDPKPPRQINDVAPKELERICLKCLSKRMTDRYSSALDLAEDLRAWISKSRAPVAAAPASSGPAAARPETHAGPVRIGPKGLRAFEKSDAGSFLNLLPGPRSRDGLPESIVFWKTRIEDRTGEMAFSVGLLYGPSGCGKSSLVKAGNSAQSRRVRAAGLRRCVARADRGSAVSRAETRLPGTTRRVWAGGSDSRYPRGRRSAEGCQGAHGPRSVRTVVPCAPGRAAPRARPRAQAMRRTAAPGFAARARRLLDGGHALFPRA